MPDNVERAVSSEPTLKEENVAQYVKISDQIIRMQVALIMATYGDDSEREARLGERVEKLREERGLLLSGATGGETLPGDGSRNRGQMVTPFFQNHWLTGEVRKDGEEAVYEIVPPSNMVLEMLQDKSLRERIGADLTKEEALELARAQYVEGTARKWGMDSRGTVTARGRLGAV